MTRGIAILEIGPSLDVFYEVEEGAGGSRAVADKGAEGVFVRAGTKLRPRFRQNPGGKGVNVARVLARLFPREPQPPAALHLFCRDGDLSRALTATLARERGLAGRLAVVHHLVGAPAPRVCTNIAVTRGGRLLHEFNLSPHAALSPADRRALLARAETLDLVGKWVVLAGTPPAIGNGNGPDADLFRDLVARLGRARVVLDTSGPGLDRCLAAASRSVEVVAINHEEALQSAAVLADFRGIKVITDRHGAVIWKGKRLLGEVRIARRPRVRCTLGAGDSVTAGFLFRYAATGDPLEAARYAQAVALSLVSSARGIDGITPARVARHLAAVEIR